MKTSFCSNCLFTFVLCLLVSLSYCEPLRATVTVQTADGRVLTGEVDEQTDGRLLWLRQQQEQIVLTTSVAWSAITSATDDGAMLPLDQLPELLRAQALGETPMGFVVQPIAYYAPCGDSGKCQEATFARPSHHDSQPVRIRSLSVEAYLVNLDHDAEPDGLELFVAARDEYGVPVPVKGSLSIRLWGERIRPHGSLVRHENLEQWTQPVVPIDFVEGVASYAFRFRTTRPEFDLGLHPETLVNVRLGVFGQGNYSASVPVQIRAFNPFRDRLQLSHGSRFLPEEFTPSRHRSRLRSWSH